jgi:hypothetical protein
VTARAAVGAASADLWHQTARLVVLNAATGACFLALAGAIELLGRPLPAFALLVLAGPPALALMHCAVRLAGTGALRLGDWVEGLRVHWRRGLVLAALGLGGVAVGGVAVLFWAGAGGIGWTFAAIAAYLLALYALHQLLLWPLVAAFPDEPLRAVLREAGVRLFQRPLAAATLGFVLLVVNVLGALPALVPLLTVTLAFSSLAAAHFALPPADEPAELDTRAPLPR